ncbi:MAG TPA: hypothetical protein VGL86_31635 [Polyangia bacterium]|jgi:hypothetical protein
MIPTWFLYLTGFSMLILGVLQLIHRPHKPNATIAERVVNLGTFWSLLCITVGVGLLLMALGYWQGPLGLAAPPPPKVPRYH